MEINFSDEKVDLSKVNDLNDIEEFTIDKKSRREYKSDFEKDQDLLKVNQLTIKGNVQPNTLSNQENTLREPLRAKKQAFEMRWFKVRDVSAKLGYRRETILRKIYAGEIIATKLGKEWRISEAELNRLLE
ncbi:helix-turn-helix domain-containing protein [Clostridium cylindrosporum]|uniref:DNA binding domain, excisionase family n=1 Tax=Clostridium cylindrosporum DSM 605 TaxID=1121307 RepID=A0A0J8D8X1_CLOCY|nr:helix-turn-helix domain-containing protein [Clostridium cylindrosporum]KMT22322.1 DNA binding domain, excisionase family [Clostridium cylindrosporum DSM 605]